MSTSRRDVLVGLATASALALSPRISPAQAAEDWAKIEEAAKKEGQLVYYCPQGPVPQEWTKQFQSRFGIRVDLLQATPTEWRERIRSEQAAGRFIADVATSGSGTQTNMTLAGQFQSFGALPLASRVESPFKERNVDDRLVIVGANPFGMLVNTNMVPEAERPKRWSDLLDAKWKGRILADDMRRDGGGYSFFGVMLDNFGPEFHRKLAKQDLIFTNNPTVQYRRIAAGEYPIYLPMSPTNLVPLMGLPVAVVMPEEGVSAAMTGAGMLKNAPHPNAARLFLNWLLTDEAQMIVVNTGSMSAISAINAKAPEGMRHLLQAKVLGSVVPDRMADQMKLAGEIYK